MTKEPIELVRQHHQRLVLGLDLLRPRERIRRSQDVIRVDTGLTVQSVPDKSRYVEEHSLGEKNERYPLIVRYHLAVLCLSGYFVFPRQVVSVLHPAVVGREADVGAGEVDGGPARDGVTDILVHADEDREDDEENDRVARAESVGEVVVVRATDLGRTGDYTGQAIHLGRSGVSLAWRWMMMEGPGAGWMRLDVEGE